MVGIGLAVTLQCSSILGLPSTTVWSPLTPVNSGGTEREGKPFNFSYKIVFGPVPIPGNIETWWKLAFMLMFNIIILISTAGRILLVSFQNCYVWGCKISKVDVMF